MDYAGNLLVTRNGKVVGLGGAGGDSTRKTRCSCRGQAGPSSMVRCLGRPIHRKTPAGVPLPKQDEYALWVFHDNIPTTNRPTLLPIGAAMDVGDGYQVKALPPTPSTGLTYRYDPGQSWVALGCAILVTGFVMALFFVPVKLYAKVVADSAGSIVEVAATTTKGNAIYEDEFASLTEGLRHAVAGDRGTEPDAPQVKVYA